MYDVDLPLPHEIRKYDGVIDTRSSWLSHCGVIDDWIAGIAEVMVHQRSFSLKDTEEILERFAERTYNQIVSELIASCLRKSWRKERNTATFPISQTAAVRSAYRDIFAFRGQTEEINGIEFELNPFLL